METRVLERLCQWEKDEGCLPENVELYRKALLIQSEVKASLNFPPASSPSCKERLGQGIPLIVFDDLEIDQSVLGNLFTQIRGVIEESLILSENETGWMKNISSDGEVLYQTARDWYDDAAAVEFRYREVDSKFIPTVMQAILWPWLSLKAASLAGELDHDNWRRGYCPMCGGKPDFTFLSEKDGSRWLSCFRCDSEWLFQRLECPYCGNTDQRKLSFFADDTAGYRVYVCRKCETYLNAIDLRSCAGEVLIPLEKVKSFNLSCLYQEQGFRPGYLLV